MQEIDWEEISFSSHCVHCIQLLCRCHNYYWLIDNNYIIIYPSWCRKSHFSHMWSSDRQTNTWLSRTNCCSRVSSSRATISSCCPPTLHLTSMNDVIIIILIIIMIIVIIITCIIIIIITWLYSEVHPSPMQCIKTNSACLKFCIMIIIIMMHTKPFYRCFECVL